MATNVSNVDKKAIGPVNVKVEASMSVFYCQIPDNSHNNKFPPKLI